jgi:hypothetical protein
MHRSDQCGQLRLHHILQFVDEHHQRRIRRLCRQTDLLDERLQVVLKVTVVGQPRLRLVIEPDFDIVEHHLELARKAGECTQAAHCISLGRFDLAQAQQCLAKLRCKQSRQGPPLRGLQPHGVYAGRFRIIPNAIQQYRLADAAQADQHGAFGRPPDACALKRNAQGFAQLVTAGKLGGRRACARCKGVADGVHGGNIPGLASLAKWDKVAKIDTYPRINHNRLLLRDLQREPGARPDLRRRNSPHRSPQSLPHGPTQDGRLHLAERVARLKRPGFTRGRIEHGIEGAHSPVGNGQHQEWPAQLGDPRHGMRVFRNTPAGPLDRASHGNDRLAARVEYQH